MSVSPEVMGQLLMQGGQGGQAQGGQNFSPSGMGQAANLLQRVLMAQQLQKQFGQQQNPNQMPPPPQTTLGAPGLPGQAQPQAMNQMQNPLAGTNA